MNRIGYGGKALATANNVRGSIFRPLAIAANSTTSNLRLPISILGNEADRHLARSAPIG
jgi:hypothetical protein